MASRSDCTSFDILKILLIFLTLCQGQINVIDYKQMPALHKYDNYYDCMVYEDVEPSYPAKYCMVLVQLQPNNESSVWQQIELMKAKRSNYRHDFLFRGLCMANCKDLLLLHNNNNGSDNGPDNGLLTIEQTLFFQQIYNNTLDRTMRYYFHKEIHECVNRDYVEKYNLTTRTFVSYCLDAQPSKAKDIYFSLALLLIIIFILINLISTFYDAKLKSQLVKPDDKNSNYYEKKHKETKYRYLTAFSLYRNYKRLVMPNKSDIGEDLAFLDGFRSILCLLIMGEHVFLVQFYHLQNTEFIENMWQQLISRLAMHAFIWLELFFVLSALLMYIKFDKSQYITVKSSLMNCVNVFVRLLISRYLRYLPSLLFVILFTSNILYYHENNTLGRGIMEANCVACRDFWWQNVLMINNFYMRNSCLMHTWYIAADFQLYSLFLILLIIMAKYPKTKMFVLISVAVIAAAINFGLNYFLKLDSVFMILPESYRYYYFRNIETSKYLYFSFYTNINSWLLGIVCGFIYMKYLKGNAANKKRLGKILDYSPYVGWPCIVAILYLGTTIMLHKETTLWTAAYGLLHRHVGLTIVSCIIILRSMCNGGGFLKFAFFRLLARISFQAYLWQIVVLLFFLLYLNEPMRINYILLYMLGVSLYAFTNSIAFVVALFVEYPISEVINVIGIEKQIKPPINS